MIEQFILYIIAFSFFVVLQSLAINGVFESTKEGMVFYGIAQFLDRKIKYEWIKKPIFKCVKCMSSLVGGGIYWPIIIYVFGFHWVEVFVWVVDVFILVVFNFIIYKKV